MAFSTQSIEPYIKTVGIAFPAKYVNTDTYWTRQYFKSNFPFIRYFHYGTHSQVIFDGRGFNPFFSIWAQIAYVIINLQALGIISYSLQTEHTKIYEIKIGYTIPMPQLFFCRHPEFSVVNKRFYRSALDYDKNTKSNGKSRHIQYSFINLTNYKTKTDLLFHFSGKYVKQMPLMILDCNSYFLLQKLLHIGSVFLSQATTPEAFNLSIGYSIALPHGLQSMLTEANWYNGKFRKRNASKNLWRVSLL
jgi:hypothetical protein